MKMHRRNLIVIVLAGAVIASLVLWYAFYVLRFSPESKAVEISKQSPIVQQFLDQYSPESVGHSVGKYYIKHDGRYYALNENWELQEYVWNASETIDGKDHYCWVAIWSLPFSMKSHDVMVFIDRDSWEIISVKEIILSPSG